MKKTKMKKSKMKKSKIKLSTFLFVDKPSYAIYQPDGLFRAVGSVARARIAISPLACSGLAGVPTHGNPMCVTKVEIIDAPPKPEHTEVVRIPFPFGGASA